MEKEKYCTGYLCPLAENCAHYNNFRNLHQAMKHSVSVMPAHYEDGTCTNYKALPAGDRTVTMDFRMENSREVRKQLEDLIRDGDALTLYAENGLHQLIPVADIRRHKGCPVELFRKVVKQVLQEDEN